MIPVYEDYYTDKRIVIGRVNPNSKLDYWDGNNWTYGGCGYHLGYTKLKKSGKYVLIHTSQHTGDRDYGVIVNPEDLIRIAVKSDNLDDLLKDFPELKGMSDDIIDEEEYIDESQ